MYNAVGDVVASVNARGYRTSYTYDSLDRRTETLDALGNVSSVVYDAVGNTLAQVDPLGHRTSYSYDALNRQTEITDALGQVSSTVYDAVGNVTAKIDALGHRTTVSYDSLNRQVEVLDALGNVSTVVYDAVGNSVAQVDARGYRTTSTYDALNRAVAVTDALNHTSTVVYDGVGNVTQKVDALGKITSYVYDALNRQVSVQSPMGALSSTVYDAVGNVVQTSDPLGHVTSYVYDNLNRQTQVVDALTGTTTLVYDGVGNNTVRVDAVGNRTTMVYDALNRQTEVIDPLGHSLTMAYDGASRLSGKTDRLGQRQEFTYDNDNRVLTEVWKDSGGSTVNTITHVYDALGNTTTLADQNGTLTWVYDGLSRVTSEQGLFGQVLTYTLDAVGNTTRVDDSQGGVTTSVYNAINLLTERDFCGVGQTPLRMDLTYTVRNQISQLDRYSDLAGTTKVGEMDTTYDDAGRTTQITHKDGSGTTLLQTTYTYDLASRLETETIDGSTHTLTYDAVNQLTGDGSTSYSFDLAGNRTMTGYQTGTGNQLTNDGVYTYTYDAEGNRVSKSKSASDENWTYGYSVANQMTWMEERATSGGTLLLRVEEKYDALGRRIEEARWTSATGTVTTRFTYQGDNVRADLDGSNALVMRYVRPDGVDALGARINAAGVASWYLTDRQGTVQGNTDASGALSNKNTYDGFGARTNQTNASASDRYLYTGRELQIDSGLQNNRARWYDTRTGSWTTIDPKGFDAGDDNLYRYVKNGPTNATDPDGRMQFAVGAGLAEIKEFLDKNNITYRAEKFGLAGSQLQGSEAIEKAATDGNVYMIVVDPSSLDKLQKSSVPEKYKGLLSWGTHTISGVSGQTDLSIIGTKTGSAYDGTIPNDGKLYLKITQSSGREFANRIYEMGYGEGELKKSDAIFMQFQAMENSPISKAGSIDSILTMLKKGQVLQAYQRYIAGLRRYYRIARTGGIPFWEAFSERYLFNPLLDGAAALTMKLGLNPRDLGTLVDGIASVVLKKDYKPLAGFFADQVIKQIKDPDIQALARQTILPLLRGEDPNWGDLALTAFSKVAKVALGKDGEMVEKVITAIATGAPIEITDEDLEGLAKIAGIMTGKGGLYQVLRLPPGSGPAIIALLSQRRTEQDTKKLLDLLIPPGQLRFTDRERAVKDIVEAYRALQKVKGNSRDPVVAVQAARKLATALSHFIDDKEGKAALLKASAAFEGALPSLLLLKNLGEAVRNLQQVYKKIQKGDLTAGANAQQAFANVAKAAEHGNDALAQAKLPRNPALAQLGATAKEIANNKMLWAAIFGAAAVMASNPACFAAGTPLLTPTGSKAVEELRPGDLLLSRSEFDEKAPIEARQVEEVFVQVALLRTLCVDGREIHTTEEHPFYVRDKGWVKAAFLEVGDLLLSHDGRWIALDGLPDTRRVATVYNVRVAENHTYFVGCDEWGFSVWAHNACWYHGTDSASAASIVANGPNAAALHAISDIDRLPGLYVTPHDSDAGDYARMRTLDRNNELKKNKLPATLSPVIIVADDAVIRPYLRPRPRAIRGEMYIPEALFPQVPRDAFKYSGLTP